MPSSSDKAMSAPARTAGRREPTITSHVRILNHAPTGNSKPAAGKVVSRSWLKSTSKPRPVSTATSTSVAYRTQRYPETRTRRCISRQTQTPNTRRNTAGSTPIKASVKPAHTASGPTLQAASMNNTPQAIKRPRQRNGSKLRIAATSHTRSRSMTTHAKDPITRTQATDVKKEYPSAIISPVVAAIPTPPPRSALIRSIVDGVRVARRQERALVFIRAESSLCADQACRLQLAQTGQAGDQGSRS